MAFTEEILRPIKNIRGGVSLPHNKNTADRPTVTMPSPERAVIPMQQHIGAPCAPTVKVGDSVFVGTKIGDSDKFVSAPIHSSVSGKVAEIGALLLPSGNTCQTVVIDSDGLDTADPSLAPRTVSTPEELVSAARDCGLVGLGGAGFPAHVKLTVSPEKPIDTLIVNAAECEPFITSDYRECVENTENILEGIHLIKNILGIKRVLIGVENNKPHAIETLAKFTERKTGKTLVPDGSDGEKMQAVYEIASDGRDTDDSVKVLKLRSHYPQGAEKVLIYTATGRKLPLGKLPSDVGCMVMNVTSISCLNKFIKTGMPLTRKTVTVDGDAIAEPQNVSVAIGTSVNDVIEFCGGYKKAARKVLCGGPMMGTALPNTSMPVMKQNNAILALSRKSTEKSAESPCIRCGRCASACPMNLQPLEIEPAFKNGDLPRVKALYADYCIECGCCSYVCPAKRHLTQTMRLAKAELKKR